MTVPLSPLAEPAAARALNGRGRPGPHSGARRALPHVGVAVWLLAAGAGSGSGGRGPHAHRPESGDPAPTRGQAAPWVPEWRRDLPEAGPLPRYLGSRRDPGRRHVLPGDQAGFEPGSYAFLIDGITPGWMAVQTLRQRYPDVFLHFHRAGHGGFTRPENPIGFSVLVLSKFARLAGASGIHTGTAGVGKMSGSPEEDVTAARNILRVEGKGHFFTQHWGKIPPQDEDAVKEQASFASALEDQTIRARLMVASDRLELPYVAHPVLGHDQPRPVRRLAAAG